MVKWVVGGIAVVVLSVALWAFEPWRVWTSSHVDEALPGGASGADVVVATAPPSPSTTTTGPGEPKAQPEAQRRAQPEAQPEAQSEPKPEILELGSGDFEDAEHGTTGVARIIELRDGSRFVRLDDLATSDGPDLVVTLSDAPSGGEWGSYDDGRQVTLGDLKATNGNQNYEIPADVDLDGLTTVVVWCERFNVAFGTAPVAA